MNAIVDVLKTVRSGTNISIHTVLATLQEVIPKCRSQSSFVERVDGHTIVIGPIRGHASDFSNHILTKVLVDSSVKNVVLLGNYIDGAHSSIEVLYLVALLILHSGLRVVALLGRHELLYPVEPENFGSLRSELLLRAVHTGDAVEEYEAIIRQFFAALPVACLVEGRFLCVAGGPASGYRLVSQMDGEQSQAALREFVLNEQMDEDEERIAEGSAFVASQNEQLAFRFTFNAACNFITRNNLSSLIIGMEYHTKRPDYDSFARPNHYKESIYFPGFILGRVHPLTRIPAVMTVFSAPSFCGVNRNNACILTIAEGRVEMQELKAYPHRPFITPGKQDHAFSWTQPMLEKATTAIAREMIFGKIVENENTEEDIHYKQLESIATAKMRRMCQLLKAHDLPLPELGKIE